MFRYVILVTVVLLTACAAPPKQSVEDLTARFKENQQAATRLYPAKSPEQVTEAIQQVLLLLDPQDMKISITEKGVLANRFSTFYAVFAVGFGMDYYSILLEQVPEGTTAKLSYEGVMNSGMITTPPPAIFKQDIPISSDQDPSDFKIFHDRVEYVLGLREQWVTCDAAAAVSSTKTPPPFFCDRLGLVNEAPAQSN